MSLINQMLKDLESRRTPDNPANTLLQGNAVETRGRHSRQLLIMLSLLVALLALVLAYMVWERLSGPAISTPAGNSAMSVEQPVETPPPPPVTVTPATAAGALSVSKVANQEAMVVPKLPPEPRPQLLAIEPRMLTGSRATQRLSIKGSNLHRDSRITVFWEGNEKLLPPQRVHWRDSNTIEIELVTGTTAGEWLVALADNQNAPLSFQVVAPAQPAPVKRADVATPPDVNEEHEPVTVVEKRIRPLRPDQLAEKAYKEGYRVLQQGNQEGAEKKWRAALRHEPGHIASREGLAALYLSQGRNVEAGEVLAKGLEHHPGHSQFALMYARIQVGNGQLGAALATLERAQGAQTQGADFFAFLAALYQRQKSYDKSVAAYQRALSMQPRQGVWWMGIGISLEGEGKTLEATTAYNEAKKSGNLPPKLVQYVEGRLKRLEGM